MEEIEKKAVDYHVVRTGHPKNEKGLMYDVTCIQINWKEHNKYANCLINICASHITNKIKNMYWIVR